MRSLGEFESLFKRALREKYQYKNLDISRIMLITDLEGGLLDDFENKVKGFLTVSLGNRNFEMSRLGRNDFSSWASLEDHLDRFKPDFIVSYRLLRVSDVRINTSLGVYIDTLSQKTNYPILVMPNPHLVTYEPPLDNAGYVVVATEHLYRDHDLVDTAVGFTPDQGKLLLVHIEDDDTFKYYVNAIERIPSINSDKAVESLKEQLESAPRHYMESVAEELQIRKPGVLVEMETGFGHLINHYTELVKGKDVRILVFQTKDDTQLAMHSLGYSLAIQFSEIPVLLT